MISIKSVELYIIYESEDLSRNKWRVEYTDETVDEMFSFCAPSKEVELFCAKAYTDCSYSVDDRGKQVKHIHYEGKHPYFN